jgi:hypothetical protein
MNNKTAELVIDTKPRSIQNFDEFSSEELMNKILRKGYESVMLDGELIHNFSDHIFLFVQDDIKLLVDGYMYFEKLLITDKGYQHGAYLNGGTFSWTVTSDRKNVKIEFKICPGLHVDNLVTYTINITEYIYTLWWRSIAHEILNLAS